MKIILWLGEHYDYIWFKYTHMSYLFLLRWLSGYGIHLSRPWLDVLKIRALRSAFIMKPFSTTNWRKSSWETPVPLMQSPTTSDYFIIALSYKILQSTRESLLIKYGEVLPKPCKPGIYQWAQILYNGSSRIIGYHIVMDGHYQKMDGYQMRLYFAVNRLHRRGSLLLINSPTLLHKIFSVALNLETCFEKKGQLVPSRES